MKLPSILHKVHEKVTIWMSKRWVVENIFIAKVTEEDGAKYDCIYCTIVRTAIIFFLFGVIFGLAIGYLL